MKSRSARLVEHAQPLLIEDVELSQPNDDEVVVDMVYGGVNPVDRYRALGRVAADGPLPRTLGSEGSGTVDGRPVMVGGYGLSTTRDGLWATRAVVPAAAIIDIPEGVELAAAAAMGVAGVTAWRLVREKARLTSEDRALVLGASGGVGSIILSIARSLGATVWGQTTSRDKAGWITARGAERVVVADAGSLVEAAGGLHPTVVFDPLGGGFTAAGVELLDPRGRLVIFGTSADSHGNLPLQVLYRKALTVYGYSGMIESDEVLAGHLADAMAALRDGGLEVVVDRILPLDQVNEAFGLLERRAVRGKVLLDLRS